MPTSQLFNSLPALNEAASYINQATSYFGSCFSDYSGIISISFIVFRSCSFHYIAVSLTKAFTVLFFLSIVSTVEYGSQDSCNSLSHPHELLRSTSGADGSSPVSVCVTPAQRCSTSSEASTSSANSPSRESTETLSQASSAMVTSNGVGFYGISMFQGYVFFL